MTFETHPAVNELIESGVKRGYITYDELNELLPDEMVEPDKIDELQTNAPEAGEEGRATAPIINAGPRVGRNDDCPCGSGKKYKKCCGK